MERSLGYVLIRFAVFLLLPGLGVSCDQAPMPLQPSAVYEVSFSDGSNPGILILSEGTDGRMPGLLYLDNGQLYADTLQVAVRSTQGGLRMHFPDGSPKKFSYKLYEAPAYEEPSPVRIFRDSVYAVRVEKDVLYGQANGYWTSYPPEGKQRFSKIYFDRAGELFGKHDCPLFMDVYLPEGAGLRARPLFLMIHGGAFYNGDKAEPEFEGWCRYFASLGYVAASINYRMGYLLLSDEVERAGYRALQDANAAVRFLVGQERYHIDPQRVFVAGTSAGAITALNLAFMQEEDRPKSTRGGVIGSLIGGIFGNNIIDEGPIDKLNPGDSTRFHICAVGNMWGAVSDLSMLDHANVAVISFHSENDPIVPYGYDNPFAILFKDVFESISDNPTYLASLRALRISENLNSVIFNKMYGSSMIDQHARTRGYRTELHSYQEKAHALHQDEEGALLPRFYEFGHMMAEFFSGEMETDPVRAHYESEQWIRVNNKAVKNLSWRLEGGVIRDMAADGIRILLFPDAPVRKVTVTGTYRSGMTFREEMDL